MSTSKNSIQKLTNFSKSLTRSFSPFLKPSFYVFLALIVFCFCLHIVPSVTPVYINASAQEFELQIGGLDNKSVNILDENLVIDNFQLNGEFIICPEDCRYSDPLLGGHHWTNTTIDPQANNTRSGRVTTVQLHEGDSARFGIIDNNLFIYFTLKGADSFVKVEECATNNCRDTAEPGKYFELRGKNNPYNRLVISGTMVSGFKLLKSLPVSSLTYNTKGVFGFNENLAITSEGSLTSGHIRFPAISKRVELINHQELFGKVEGIFHSSIKDNQFQSYFYGQTRLLNLNFFQFSGTLYVSQLETLLANRSYLLLLTIMGLFMTLTKFIKELVNVS